VLSPGLGTGLFLCARYRNAVAGFNTLGRKRLPSEEVAELTCRDLLTHHRTGATVDPYLADQLVLPFAIAQGKSCASVSRITRHLLTSVWVTQQFGFHDIRVEGQVGKSGMLVSDGILDGSFINKQWSNVC
jgi:RNA 3'-terminal phosphate cyclase (ATP)